MLRAASFAMLLLATTLVLGGTVGVDVAPPASASCGPIALGDDPCPPHPACVVAESIERTTREEMHCIE